MFKDVNIVYLQNLIVFRVKNKSNVLKNYINIYRLHLKYYKINLKLKLNVNHRDNYSIQCRNIKLVQSIEGDYMIKTASYD